MSGPAAMITANVVPGGALNTMTIAAGAIGEDIFCGRYLNDDTATPGAAADISICCKLA